MDIEGIKQEALNLLEQAKSSQEIGELKVRFLGRKGELISLLRELGTLPAEERKDAGARLNQAKADLEAVFKDRSASIAKIEQDEKLASEKIDISMPGREQRIGYMHPLSIVQEEIAEVFHRLGFVVRQGPIIETDFYNFEALNFPQWHPARAMQDTFYIDGERLLRTHTSTIQIRTMKSGPPPVRMIAMGACHRRDASDATHSPFFHQLEGLMIDKHVSFSDLAGILALILSNIFGGNVKVKFLPSFFPFTEPSAETIASCPFCGGKGCKICQNSGWIEMGGSGMVHPNVLEKVGYDPNVYQGFAFGWGIERIAILKFGVSDIRDFTNCDMRFLKQFGGAR